MKLTERQQRDKEELLQILETEPIALLAASTGYGKTVVTWSLIQDWVNEGKRVLVLTHGRKELRDNFSLSIAAMKKNVAVYTGSPDREKASRSKVVISLPHYYLDLRPLQRAGFFMFFL